MLTIGVLREREPDERRVALVPSEVGRLAAAGMRVLVEAGAGVRAWLPDEAYARAGADVANRDEVCAQSDVLVSVGRPDQELTARLRRDQAFVGFLAPSANPVQVRELGERGVTLVSFDGLPRTASRAQAMDAMSSQASVAGYKAALVAANAFGRYFPMFVTAAGTARPARVLVLGAGVAGLQAIATARRLGAVVSGFDVRAQAAEEVRSLGASFVEVAEFGGVDGAGEGGYARALSAEEQRALPDALAAHIARADVVISTARVPGRRPPLLVSEEAVKAMEPGSVIVDLAADQLGGNVALTRADEVVVTGNGVTIVGAANLASTVPTAASSAFSRNVAALLLHLVRDGQLAIDLTDEIHAGVVLAHRGRLSCPDVRGIPS